MTDGGVVNGKSGINALLSVQDAEKRFTLITRKNTGKHTHPLPILEMVSAIVMIAVILQTTGQNIKHYSPSYIEGDFYV